MRIQSHRQRRRQSMLAGGFVGVLLLTAGSLTLWPHADEIASAASVASLPQLDADANQTTLATARQIPLSALALNPFARSQSTPAGEGDRQALLAAVQKLHLDSVFCVDAKRSCTINGRHYAEAERVQDFVIESVTPSSVALKSGLYRFELRMQQ